jgi:pimeloyl-ACP methyl ester carboxylesterase
MLKAFDDGRLFGATFGSAAPWVLALHGWRRTHRDWDDVLDGLDAIALDLPGFGATDLPPEPWGSPEYAKAIAPVLERDFDRPAVVIGHSFGGRVATHLAAAYPDRVAALVLTGVPGLVTLPGAASKRPPMAYRAARALNRRGILPDRQMERIRQRRGSADYLAATGVMRDILVTVTNEVYEQPLRESDCPIELVWGDDDGQAPVAVARAAAEMLGSRANLVLVPAAGHFTPMTAPDALREAIERHRPAA